MKTEMKTRILTYLPTLISCLLLAACSQNVHIDRHTGYRPPISPDYTEVTLPPNMAPPLLRPAGQLPCLPSPGHIPGRR